MTDVKDLVRMQREKDKRGAPARQSEGKDLRTKTWIAYRLKVAKVKPISIGIEMGGTEPYIDPRDGQACLRPKLAFLPRKHVAVMPGSRLAEGQEAVIDVPRWLAERVGLKDEWRVL